MHSDKSVSSCIFKWPWNRLLEHNTEWMNKKLYFDASRNGDMLRYPNWCMLKMNEPRKKETDSKSQCTYIRSPNYALNARNSFGYLTDDQCHSRPTKWYLPINMGFNERTPVREPNHSNEWIGFNYNINRKCYKSWYSFFFLPLSLSLTQNTSFARSFIFASAVDFFFRRIFTVTWWLRIE